jgi:hypothetical protein
VDDPFAKRPATIPSRLSHVSMDRSGLTFDWSGDFECRLTSLYSHDSFSTLFADNPRVTRDWDTRARFLAEELIGSCASYPEHGALRHFRLRGMTITLSIHDVVFDSTLMDNGDLRPSLKSFRFVISVERNPAVHSSLTQRVPYPWPEYTDVRRRASLSCPLRAGPPR